MSSRRESEACARCSRCTRAARGSGGRCTVAAWANWAWAGARSSCSRRCFTLTRPTMWRRASTTRTTRPVACPGVRWRLAPTPPASAGRPRRGRLHGLLLGRAVVFPNTVLRGVPRAEFRTVPRVEVLRRCHAAREPEVVSHRVDHVVASVADVVCDENVGDRPPLRVLAQRDPLELLQSAGVDAGGLDDAHVGDRLHHAVGGVELDAGGLDGVVRPALAGDQVLLSPGQETVVGPPAAVPDPGAFGGVAGLPSDSKADERGDGSADQRPREAEEGGGGPIRNEQHGAHGVHDRSCTGGVPDESGGRESKAGVSAYSRKALWWEERANMSATCTAATR